MIRTNMILLSITSSHAGENKNTNSHGGVAAQIALVIIINFLLGKDSVPSKPVRYSAAEGSALHCNNTLDL